jgi:hypothetical protein
MRKIIICSLLFVICHLYAEPLYSPVWGFSCDLPQEFEFSGGEEKSGYSFSSAGGASFDITVYGEGRRGKIYDGPLDLMKDIAGRLNNRGDVSGFEYRGKKAALMELQFAMGAAAGGRSAPMEGWALAVEMPASGKNTASPLAGTSSPPLLLALAYGQKGKAELQPLYASALDSLAPSEEDRGAPGPLTEFSYPRKTRGKMPIAVLDCEAWFFAEDAEASQAVVDREFKVLSRAADKPGWEKAWGRFYRMIYRDAWDRLADAAFIVERRLNASFRARAAKRGSRELADAALHWVQGFRYERNFLGSDFVNPVSACIEGRGDCDARSLLWALVLSQADIPASMMVSKEYSHAMGLAELPGEGARFKMDGKDWLVAETTAKVSVGRIGESVSDSTGWIGVALE